MTTWVLWLVRRNIVLFNKGILVRGQIVYSRRRVRGSYYSLDRTLVFSKGRKVVMRPRRDDE